jgi:acetyltransferase-like isoleucine patch superfamily enzyme
MAGARVGACCNICDHAFVESGAVIGDRVTVKNRAMIWEGVTIEDDVFVGPGVIFTNDRYPRSARDPAVPKPAKSAWLVPTLVCRSATLGAGAVIVCGVTIGRFAMIGAGAVVTRDVPDHRLVLGNPATGRGWVCTCGRPLGTAYSCPACDRRYSVLEGELRLL